MAGSRANCSAFNDCESAVSDHPTQTTSGNAILSATARNVSVKFVLPQVGLIGSARPPQPASGYTLTHQRNRHRVFLSLALQPPISQEVKQSSSSFRSFKPVHLNGSSSPIAAIQIREPFIHLAQVRTRAPLTPCGSTRRR